MKTNIQICQTVVSSKSAVSFKYEIEDDFEHPTVRDDFSLSNSGWCLLDIQSANAVVQVYKALNEQNQTDYNRYPIQWMVKTAWELIAKSNKAAKI